MGESAKTSSKQPRRVDLAQGAGWILRGYHCDAGPSDRPFEEIHEGASLSLVTAGTFDYRTATGRAVLYPGAFLLGNAGECFECGHSHSVGDHCLALHLTSETFAEVAATAAGSSRFKFNCPVLPADPALTSAAVSLHALAAIEAAEADAAVYQLIESAVGLLAGLAPASRRPAPRDQRRIAKVLRHLEQPGSEREPLSDLAALAHMSKYHFLRIFRRTTGTTPHQYVLAMRLQRAALKLARSQEPIAILALGAGFDDVSTFNRYFRRAFKLTPTSYRRKYLRSAP
jgi:AraC family transcriptional regulator